MAYKLYQPGLAANHKPALSVGRTWQSRGRVSTTAALVRIACLFVQATPLRARSLNLD